MHLINTGTTVSSKCIMFSKEKLCSWIPTKAQFICIKWHRAHPVAPSGCCWKWGLIRIPARYSGSRQTRCGQAGGCSERLCSNPSRQSRGTPKIWIFLHSGCTKESKFFVRAENAGKKPWQFTGRHLCCINTSVIINKWFMELVLNYSRLDWLEWQGCA